ncbi:Alpha-N-acetylgalactosaminidase, partial [Operophtera brumata]
GLDNGLALTPPMGWLTWERFRCITDCDKYPNECISENLIKRTADFMVSEGYLAAGYQYLGIDDCWLEKQRGADGRMTPDRRRFPHGMKPVADYVSIPIAAGYQYLGIDDCWLEKQHGADGRMTPDRRRFPHGMKPVADYYLGIADCWLEKQRGADGRMTPDGRRFPHGMKPVADYYLGIDDCWLEKQRGADGRMTPDRRRFPHGMKPLADYIHGKGLKFGMYQDYGNLTCAGYPGVLGNEKLDIDTLVEWEIDYLKLDGCYIDPTAMDTAKHCNLWRNWDDIEDSWASLTKIMDWFADNQDRTDLTTIRPEFKEILLNRGVIAVNQDVLGKQGTRALRTPLPSRTTTCSYLSKPTLSSSGAPYAATFTYYDMQLPQQAYTVEVSTII